MSDEFPDSWKIKTIEEVCEKPQYGFTASAFENKIGPKLVRITDITEDRINWESVPYCECEEIIAEKYLLEKGDLLFARTGTTGASTLITDVPERAVFASYLIRLKPKKEIETYYLNQFFKSSIYWKQITQKQVGAIQKGINASVLKSIILPYPPLVEQRGIAEVLGTVDEAIQRTDAVIAKAEELKRGLMQRLLTRGIGHTKFKQTELGEIPETWKMVRLEDVILDIKYGTSLKSTIKEKGIPILRIPNIIHGKITLDEIKRIEISEKEVASFLLNEGDLLVVRTNANPDYIGRCAPFKGIEGKWIYASYLLRLAPLKEKIDTNYLNYFLTGETGRKQICKIARTSAGNYNINIPSLLSLKVALPDYTEQMKISNGFSNLDEKIELEVLKKTKLESLKINLMQVLYSGRVRVRLDEGGLHRVGDG
jgi:type I restriction enzyme S subunit